MAKICYSFGEHTLEYCVAMNHFFKEEAIELRLDLLHFQEKELKSFFKEKDSTIIVTYYIDEDDDELIVASETKKASKLLAQAIVLGADYVTIPYDFDPKEINWLTHLALNHQCKLIFAYHNKYGTPATSELINIAKKCYSLGADIVKIVTTAHHPSEAKRVLELYNTFNPSTLIAFAMGDAGTQSRKDSYEKGAPFMFATTLRDYSTAKGQLCFYDLLPKEQKLDIGKIFVPSSKSLAIRAIIAASLTDNKQSILNNIDFCDDVSAAVGVAQQLFAEISVDMAKKSLTIIGHQNILQEGLKVKDNSIYVGESGLLARLCIPLCGLSNDDIIINGSQTLLNRKVNEHSLVLKKHGLDIKYHKRFYLPVTVKGRLTGGDFVLNGEKGSQLISGLLFSLPFCSERSSLIIKNPTSLPYVLNTLAVLKDFGITINDYDDFKNTFEISLEGNQSPTGNNCTIESDWSAAALWLVAGILAGESGVEDLRYDTLQADSLIMDTFDACGADIGCYNYETGSTKDYFFQANKSVCIPFNADLTHNPDLIGPLLLLALRCEGTSTIKGIKRLKNKESNRAVSFVEEFKKLGANITIDKDSIIVTGSFYNTLHGAKVSSHGDHRLALALSVAQLITEGQIEIDDTICMCKSWPDFNLNI